MSNSNNPWKGLSILEKIRVDSKNRVAECYWFVDSNGKYGYLVETSKVDIDINTTMNLKGIQVMVASEQGTSRLILTLDLKEDWEIFFALCRDLTTASDNISTIDGFIASIQQRLNRWQSLLRMSRDQEMSRIIQMGLFTELNFLLNNLITELGVKQSVISWVGPDSDKQDFLLENSVVEVKSYRTSKGQKISISSVGQLFSEKDPLYLASYALSTGESGMTVADLINSIESLIAPKDESLFELLGDKLTSYGYIPESPNSILLQFVIDSENFYLVSELFPKIIPTDIPKSIADIRYSIDLSECKDFLIEKIDLV
jgi:hypothetical protein